MAQAGNLAKLETAHFFLEFGTTLTLTKNPYIKIFNAFYFKGRPGLSLHSDFQPWQVSSSGYNMYVQYTIGQMQIYDGVVNYPAPFTGGKQRELV